MHETLPDLHDDLHARLWPLPAATRRHADEPVRSIHELLRDQRDERHRNLGASPERMRRVNDWPPRQGKAPDLARLPECRAGSRQRQSADERAGPDRRGSLVQRRLVVVADNPAELHSRPGDAAVFLDERGSASTVSGPARRPGPARHPHGSNADGTLLPFDMLGLDFRFSGDVGASGAFRRDGPEQNTAGALRRGTRRMQA